MHKWQLMDLPHFAELVLQAEQVGLKDACRKADEQRSKMQLDTEALELRLAHLHTQPSSRTSSPSHFLLFWKAAVSRLATACTADQDSWQISGLISQDQPRPHLCSLSLLQQAFDLSLVCRVFTTHEQLAVSEEREAELAAAVQEAKQSAAAARQALAANQQAVKPQPSPVLQDEQVSLSTQAQSCCICRSAHPCTYPIAYGSV